MSSLSVKPQHGPHLSNRSSQHGDLGLHLLSSEWAMCSLSSLPSHSRPVLATRLCLLDTPRACESWGTSRRHSVALGCGVQSRHF